MSKCDHPYEDCCEEDCYCGCTECTPFDDSEETE